MAEREVSRREFFKQVGATVGAAALGSMAAGALVPQRAAAQTPPKGNIPDTPYKIGHMTFLSGAAAVLGAPMLKGHILAAEEINAEGGLLGKRKIETITADEAAGTDANVKEFKRMKLEAKIDCFTGITAHITKTISAKPDLLVSSVWGGDYIAFYKQGLGYGLFEKMKFASTIAFGVAPHAIGKDHPQGVIAGVHANYYWNFPPGNKWPINNLFVRQYYNRWKEYPNSEAEGAYTAVHMLRMAIARAHRLARGWPDDDAIIYELEGLSWESPAGYIQIRPHNHQAYNDTATGSPYDDKNLPFLVLDPNRMVTIPIRNITAPPGWPKGEPTSTYTWIEQTWPKVRS